LFELGLAILRYGHIVTLARNYKALYWKGSYGMLQHIHVQVCGWTPPPTSFIRGHQSVAYGLDGACNQIDD
jgi:hypothetical protein